MVNALELHGIPSEETVLALGEFLSWPVLTEIQPEQVRPDIFPLSFTQTNGILALQEGPGQPLTFALCNPFDLELLDLLGRYPQSRRSLIAHRQLEQVLHFQREPELIPKPDRAGVVLEQTSALPIVDLSDLENELAHYQQSPSIQASAEAEESEQLEENSPFICRLLNRIIENAFQMEASDIHIEPREHEVVIRYRLDGQLHQIHSLKPRRILLPLISRLKIMAGLDIAEHRLPQDGRIHFQLFSSRVTQLDLRVSVIASQFGESAVMRLIYKSRSRVALEHFGFSERALAQYRQGLTHPFGLILHVGPTGSGKTTTLYAALHELNLPERKILTVEDPVEYTIPGIVQVEVQPEIGLSFQRALKAFLRHDPDVILVGEIRDYETAKIAIEASLTGHLVLATMHTNDAPSTVIRFMEMGIPPFMISSSLMMVCAQRLVRRLCVHCRESYEASSFQKQQLQVDLSQSLHLFQVKGCERCGMTGYHGRIGIYEVLLCNEILRDAMMRPDCTTETLRNLAIRHANLVPLHQDAKSKVVAGLTSFAESTARIQDPCWI